MVDLMSQQNLMDFFNFQSLLFLPGLTVRSGHVVLCSTKNLVFGFEFGQETPNLQILTSLQHSLIKKMVAGT